MHESGEILMSQGHSQVLTEATINLSFPWVQPGSTLSADSSSPHRNAQGREAWRGERIIDDD
jgi:hypothetical protein